MPKLIDLKEWLSLQEAARYLSSLFGEEVQEADVLRLGLDGRLKISVHFVNNAYAKPCEVVSLDQVHWHECVIPSRGTAPNDDVLMVPDCLRLDEDRWVRIEARIVTLVDVWDLAMIGTEHLDLEHAYQMCTGGPAVTLEGLEGAFVEGQGKLWQIQESYDNNPYMHGSSAELQQINENIARENLNVEAANALREEHAKHRKELLKLQRTAPRHESFYPSSLPTDSVFVVRTSALRQFEDDARGTLDKPLGSTERNTLLAIVAALCKKSGIDYQARGAAAHVARLTERIGTPISHDTVKRVLAKLPDAIESRNH